MRDQKPQNSMISGFLILVGTLIYGFYYTKMLKEIQEDCGHLFENKIVNTEIKTFEFCFESTCTELV